MNADAKEFLFKKKYDLIISNPPFYENELKGDNSKKNMAHHNEGLLLDDLLTVIKNNLADNGVFFLLLPYKRNEEIKNLFAENNLEITLTAIDNASAPIKSALGDINKAQNDVRKSGEEAGAGLATDAFRRRSPTGHSYV